MDQISTSASEPAHFIKIFTSGPPPRPSTHPYPRGNGCGLWSSIPRLGTCQYRLGPTLRGCPRPPMTSFDACRVSGVVVKVQNSCVGGLGFVPSWGVIYKHKFNLVQVQIYLYLPHQRFYMR